MVNQTPIPAPNKILSTISGLGSLGAWALVVLLVIEIGLAIWLAPAKISEIRDNRRKISDLTAETTTLEHQVDTLSAIDTSRISSQLAKTSLTLPSEKKVSGLVSGLTTLASSSGLLLNELDFSPGQLSSGSATPQIPVSSDQDAVVLDSGAKGIILSLSLTGSEDQMRDFLGKIPQASPVLGIKNLTYSLNEQNNSGQLSLILYYFPQAQSADLTKITPLTAQEESFVQALSKRSFILPAK